MHVHCQDGCQKPQVHLPEIMGHHWLAQQNTMFCITMISCGQYWRVQSCETTCLELQTCSIDQKLCFFKCQKTTFDVLGGHLCTQKKQQTNKIGRSKLLEGPWHDMNPPFSDSTKQHKSHHTNKKRHNVFLYIYICFPYGSHLYTPFF